jgi:hypothetical protein
VLTAALRAGILKKVIDLTLLKLLQASALNGEQLLRNENMKRKHVTMAVLLAALSFVAAPSASAISRQDVQAIKEAVANVPAAEVAAKAAQIVRQANDADRQDVAVATVREVVTQRPATVLAVVAAVSKAAPSASAAVAAEAARIVTDKAPEIAQVAATNAPAQADQIAAAVAKVAPKSATDVTRSVASVVPDQTAKVVEKVVASVPAAQAGINQDATLTRLSQSSAANPGGTGIITTRPGTISGTPPPNTPPTGTGAPTSGSDPRRQYATP